MVLVVWLMTQYLQLHTILSFICRDCILRRSGKHFPWRIYFYSKIVKYETSVFSPLVGRYYTLVVAANERRWRRVRNQLKVVADSFKLLDIWEWCSLRAHDFQQQYGSGARLFLLWLIVSMFQILCQTENFSCASLLCILFQRSVRISLPRVHCAFQEELNSNDNIFGGVMPSIL